MPSSSVALLPSNAATSVLHLQTALMLAPADFALTVSANTDALLTISPHQSRLLSAEILAPHLQTVPTLAHADCASTVNASTDALFMILIMPRPISSVLNAVTLVLPQATAPMLAPADCALMDSANTDALMKSSLPQSRPLSAVILVQLQATAQTLVHADFALKVPANTDAQSSMESPSSLLVQLSAEILARPHLIALMPAPADSASMELASTDAWNETPFSLSCDQQLLNIKIILDYNN